jgi:hypothetical protein
VGLEGIVSKRKDFALPFRPLARLAQDEKPECAGREAGGRGGLGAMTHLRSFEKHRQLILDQLKNADRQ